MKAHRTCLFAAAALGAVVLFGCNTTPTPGTTWDKAKELQNDGKYSDAVAKYKQFIAEKEIPGLAPYAQYEIARSYRSLGKMMEARGAYMQVMDLYPTSEVAQWAKAELKEVDKAMEAPPPAKMAPVAPKSNTAAPAPK